MYNYVADMVEQAVQLQNRPHVVIATPGRLADHIRTSAGTLHLQKCEFFASLMLVTHNRVKYLVLDEADRLMSNDTIQADLGAYLTQHNNSLPSETVLGALPARKQTLLFSATMPKELTGVISRTVRQPAFQYEVAGRSLMP